MSTDVTISVEFIRKLRFICEKLSKEIHSSGYLPVADKRSMLAKVAICKKELDSYLQLGLFTSQQLNKK